MPDPRLSCRLLFSGMMAVASVAHPAYAENTIEGVQSNLQETIQELRSVSATGKELEKKEKVLQRELSTLQDDLVALAERIREQEKQLTALETDIAVLKDEEARTHNELTTRQATLAHTLQSMIKFSHVPPEMVMVMPGDFNEVLRTAKVLGLTSTALSQEAGAIRQKLGEIRELQIQIESRYAEIRDNAENLESEQKTLEKKLAMRGTLQAHLLDRKEEHEREMARLSAKSDSLKDLLGKLEENRRKKETAVQHLALIPQMKPSYKGSPPSRQQPAGKPDTSSRKFAGVKGKISLPAEGEIFSFFGDAAETGDKSKGINIRTRAKAQVTAPYSGEIVYTGTFLAYGNLVILRHGSGYHTLLAGMEKVTCITGQHVLKGEPVGEMGSTKTATALYMEIRKNNHPVDPIPWLESSRFANN